MQSHCCSYFPAHTRLPLVAPFAWKGYILGELWHWDSHGPSNSSLLTEPSKLSGMANVLLEHAAAYQRRGGRTWARFVTGQLGLFIQPHVFGLGHRQRVRRELCEDRQTALLMTRPCPKKRETGYQCTPHCKWSCSAVKLWWTAQTSLWLHCQINLHNRLPAEEWEVGLRPTAIMKTSYFHSFVIMSNKKKCLRKYVHEMLQYNCILTQNTKEDTFYLYRNNGPHTQRTICTSTAGLSHWRVLKMACRSFIVGLLDRGGTAGGRKQCEDQ